MAGAAGVSHRPSRPLRTVYLGTSEFAAEILRRLSGTPHRPVLVVSRPDSQQGRGRKLTAPPTVAVARELGIDVFQPQAVNDDESRARIAAADPETLIVCAFGALIKEPLLSDAPIVNVHPSLLPRWRGAAPIERAILAGDTETGVSIMRLTAGLDSGPVCLQERTPIEPHDDYGSLAKKLEALGGDLLLKALDESPAFTEQDETQVTYAEKLTAEDRRLDLNQPAQELERRVRALSPHIGAYVELSDGTRLGVWKAALQNDFSLCNTAGIPGRKVILGGPLPLVPTPDGALALLEVQPPGKKRMSAVDWMRGLKA